MGPWQTRTLATAAIMTAAIPVGTEIFKSIIQHPVTGGIHIKAELPAGWAVEWKVEPAQAHDASAVCVVPGVPQ